MKKGIYIYQDVVSNGVSDVFTADNDRMVKRYFGVMCSRCPAEQAYMYRDTNAYKIGVLYIDDESGQLAIEPVAPALVCRGTDFSIGSGAPVQFDEKKIAEALSDLPTADEIEFPY